MRDIKIFLEKSVFLPGDEISGHVLVKCDKEFKCNRIVIGFLGAVNTVITVGSDDDETTYTETIKIVETGLVLHEGGTVYAGESKFEFSFRLPDRVPPSYEGFYGKIQYGLEAKIELSWAIDPKDRLLLNVIFPYRKEVGKGVRVAYEDKEDMHPPLEVQLENTSFCIGELVPFKVRVSSGEKIRKVRFELIHQESASARGHKSKYPQTLAKSSIDAEDIQYDTWFAVGVEIPPSTPPSFDVSIIKSHLLLRVTLDIPWRFDKSVEVLLVCGHCVGHSQVDADPFGP